MQELAPSVEAVERLEAYLAEHLGAYLVGLAFAKQTEVPVERHLVEEHPAASVTESPLLSELLSQSPWASVAGSVRS